MTVHFKTEEEAIASCPYPNKVSRFIDGTLTVLWVNGTPFPQPYLLLRENEGLYWQEADTE